MRRQFRGNRRAAVRPALSWSDVSGQWTFAGVTGGSQSILVQLQSPAALNNLTSDPPEDLTVLRLVGDYQVTMAGLLAVWTLAVIVQDVAWTQSASVTGDNDKRILWSQQYWAGTGDSTTWSPPGMASQSLGAVVEKFSAPREAVHIDISPRVRVEPGKALYLVAYEEQGTGTLTVTSYNMRLLYKRSGRQSR